MCPRVCTGWKKTRPADLAFSPLENRKARMLGKQESKERSGEGKRTHRERSSWTKEQGSVASNIRET